MPGTFIPDFSITGLSEEGAAFGMHGLIKVFVEKGIPGDVADINMIKFYRDKTLASAKIVSIKKPSPFRIDAFCKHFNYCGGCQWQNISYADQLKFKQKQVQELFSGIPYEYKTLPILGSAQQKYFRNRVTFTFSNRRWMSPEELKDPEILKQPAAGYVLKGNNDRIMNIEECFLTDDFAIKLMHSLRDEVLGRGYSFYDVRHEKGFLRSLTVRFGDLTPIGRHSFSEGDLGLSPSSFAKASADKKERGENSHPDIMAIVVFGEDNQEKVEQVMNYLKETFPQITSLFYVIHKRKRGVISDKAHIHFSGKTFLTYKLEDLKFHIGPNSFYQTNSKQTLELYKVARDFANLKGDETVYDLYTGTGTIALFVARSAKKVIGMDYIPQAIEDAKKNAMLNSIENTTFLSGDLKDVFNEDTFNKYGKPDVVITDPPRAGMNLPGIKNLILSEAKRIVYISCNPVTQVRDIRNLNEHYRLVQSQAVDMFPQTSHIENVVVLERILR